MPPKTRGSKTLKVSKENVGVASKPKLKSVGNPKRLPRKALADKTNSATDDNATLPPSKQVKTSLKNEKVIENDAGKPRQRRERRVPIRYIGNPVLVNLSNSNLEVSSPNSTPIKSRVKKTLPLKNNAPRVSPLKTISKALVNSVLKSRPKRICRLPSKFDEHSISPNKFISLQPLCASTPVPIKTIKITESPVLNQNNSYNKTPPARNSVKKPLSLKVHNNKIKAAPDSNNNGKKQLHIDKCFEKQIKSAKSKKIVHNNSTFRVFDDIKKSRKRDSSKIDPYEFTFDPDEEPTPQKKKKKRTVKKNQPKPKTVVRGIYEKNLAKALAIIKKNVAMKTQLNKELQAHPVSKPHADATSDIHTKNMDANNIIELSHKNETNEKPTEVNQPNNNINKSIPCENNYNSVRIEDIALDLQIPDDGHTIDYSPVNSPCPISSQKPIQNKKTSVNDKDPLNLQGDLSYFDDEPVASSSMNMSVRHPLASPWRVEFGNLPIKWQVNTYVKPNMTPAVESSFINFNDRKKKHVYTNMITEGNEPLAQIADTSLKQTSIISFIREVAEKSAKKKMKSTPVKANSLFEDITHPSLIITPTKSVSSKNNSKNSVNSRSSYSENDINNKDIHNSVSKTPDKKGDSTKRGTFFGFDESEDENQENISPVKKDKKKKALKSRSRAVLHEINDLKGPSRVVIPISVRPLLNSDNLNKDLVDPKLVLEPTVYPNKETVLIETTQLNTLDDDSQSVHLFEDIDLKHHYHQPPRKSYGKAKKVMFRQNSVSDSDASLNNNEDSHSSEEDNLDDLSFKLPVAKPKRIVKKKRTKKQKLSKKEEQEVDKWAAGFNSMCEDVEEFDLIVE